MVTLPTPLFANGLQKKSFLKRLLSSCYHAPLAQPGTCLPAGREHLTGMEICMFYVYALTSEQDGALYIGISSNPQKRLYEHNVGMTRSTRNRRPFRLIYAEKCLDRKMARKREKQLKSGSGREFLKKNFTSNSKPTRYAPLAQPGRASDS